MSRCDVIAEATVMGEALSADDQAHVATCAACQRLTSLPAQVGASSTNPAVPDADTTPDTDDPLQTLASFQRGKRVDWQRIEAPLDPYRRLLSRGGRK